MKQPISFGAHFSILFFFTGHVLLEELDLFEQCQQEALDFEKLTLFMDLYEAAAHAAKQQVTYYQ
eukprot:2721928-Amphidinium_carterae.1